MSDDTGLSARKIEQILRDAGISKSVARAIVAHGFRAADQAEADQAEALVKTIDAVCERLRRICNGN